jgi:hypothetical protein
VTKNKILRLKMAGLKKGQYAKDRKEYKKF